jgi:hypothetical protein
VWVQIRGLGERFDGAKCDIAGCSSQVVLVGDALSSRLPALTYVGETDDPTLELIGRGRVRRTGYT